MDVAGRPADHASGAGASLDSPTHRRVLAEVIAAAVGNVAAGGGPFAAAVVRDGEVVALGGNRVVRDHDPTAHAEVVAIRAACRALERFDLRGCVLLSSCEPCPMCRAAALWARLDAVGYAASVADAAAAGFDDAAFAAELAVPGAGVLLPLRQLDVPEAVAPFRAWAARADRVPY
jgi:tRNA(Arg) A34 adenosine deaminase TadA